jgi:ADP-heptose:LPS heptosyltransferase
MTSLQEKISNRWYTKLLDPPLGKDHEIVSHLRFIEGLNGEMDEKFVPRLPPISTTADVSRFGLPDKYVLFFPGVQLTNKLWSTEKFAAVARALRTEYDLEIVTCGGPGDERLGDSFSKAFGGPFMNLIGKTTLPELLSLIGNAVIVITNDTLAGHFAVAADRRLVVVAPGFHEGRYFPYPDEFNPEGRQRTVFHRMPCFGCNWHCIYKNLDPDAPKPCIENISAESVVEAVRSVLRSNNQKSLNSV